MKPDPFVTKGLTEYFWRTRAWGVIDDLFGDVHNIVMIGGDAAGIDSATRKNSQKRKAGDNGKKVVGDKSDGFLREFGAEPRDWMAMEGSKDWDFFGKKYQTERSWKIGRELHDIFSARAGEFNEPLENLAIFGIIFGGKW